MSRALIIDCDPGLDDAVAIALAAASPTLSLEAITTVAGNAPIEVVTENALAIREALDLEVPVHRGAGRALLVEPRTSTMLWGGDGTLGLPVSRCPAGDDAVTFLVRTLAASPRPRTVCAVGPLTNLALLMDLHAGAVERIDGLTLMGGALGRGNATPHAELNIWVDPHAAARVFAIEVPITVVPLDLTRRVVARQKHVEALTRSATAPARLSARLLPKAGVDSHPASIHDACAVGILLWPELFQTEDGEISVVSEGAEEGRTVFERKAGGRHRVAVELDLETFLDRLVATLTGAGEQGDGA